VVLPVITAAVFSASHFLEVAAALASAFAAFYSDLATYLTNSFLSEVAAAFATTFLAASLPDSFSSLESSPPDSSSSSP
jgi:hypothetical protein